MPDGPVSSLRAPWLLALCSGLLVVLAVGSLFELGGVDHRGVLGGDLEAPPVPARPEPPSTGPVLLGGKPLAGCNPAGATHVFNGTGRRVALTFDDGPSKSTDEILDILERKKVKATFFVNGRNFGGHRDTLRRILGDGHSVGNHTFDHLDMSKADRRSIGMIRRNDRDLYSLTGYKPCLFRAPYGATTPKSLAKVRKLGMLTIRWNVDTADYKGASAVAIANEAVRSSKPGAIVLMHDGPPESDRSPTVRALPGIIDRLEKRGYQLVSVEQLLGLQRRFGRPRARAA